MLNRGIQVDERKYPRFVMHDDVKRTLRFGAKSRRGKVYPAASTTSRTPMAAYCYRGSIG